MPSITIKRAGGWTDRFRAYAVYIDDKEGGAIRAKETQTFDVPAGSHRVQLRIGPIYSSPTVTLQVEAAGIALECGSNTIPGLAFMALARPNVWIYLRPAGFRAA